MCEDNEISFKTAFKDILNSKSKEQSKDEELSPVQSESYLDNINNESSSDEEQVQAIKADTETKLLQLFQKCKLNYDKEPSAQNPENQAANSFIPEEQVDGAQKDEKCVSLPFDEKCSMINNKYWRKSNDNKALKEASVEEKVECNNKKNKKKKNQKFHKLELNEEEQEIKSIFTPRVYSSNIHTNPNEIYSADDADLLAAQRMKSSQPRRWGPRPCDPSFCSDPQPALRPVRRTPREPVVFDDSLWDESLEVKLE